jgi:hypothetical protein
VIVDGSERPGADDAAVGIRGIHIGLDQPEADREGVEGSHQTKFPQPESSWT